MAVKTLADFNYDYLAYVEYLESAQYTNDEGYDVIADEKGNIYKPTEGDWEKGHGHENVFNGYKRDPENKKSYGRKWENRWLKLFDKLNLTEEEIQFLVLGYEDYESRNNKHKILSKKIWKRY